MFTPNVRKVALVGINNSQSIYCDCARALELRMPDLIDETIDRASRHPRISIDGVGRLSAGRISDAARMLTGGTTYIDGGYNIVGG